MTEKPCRIGETRFTLLGVGAMNSPRYSPAGLLIFRGPVRVAIDGGLGAVMGAKNLKAIAVRAAAKVTTADPAAVLAAARDLRERSFGPATAKYRELGTLANLLTFNAVSTSTG